jgi:flagellar export protein FliJ
MSIKSLETLLKIAQRKMDELGVEAGRVGTQIAELQTKQATLRAREENEVRLAADDLSLGPLLPAYRLKVKWQCDQLGAEVIKAETVLAEIRQRLNEAYQEKAKFEQLLEQETIRRATERAAKEQAQLDEVAINRAGRG